MAGVVVFKSAAEAERVLGPGKGQFCKNHPKVESKRNRNGVYIGLCPACSSARSTANRRGGNPINKIMTPAVARDLKKRATGETPAPPDARSAKAAGPGAEGGHTGPPLRAASEGSRNTPMCLTHNLPIKFNRKGVSMGGCEECRREIAAMGGHKAKIQLALNPLERIFADYPVELVWLLAYAAKQVRTPEGQLIYLCRQAMAVSEEIRVETASKIPGPHG